MSEWRPISEYREGLAVAWDAMTQALAIVSAPPPPGAATHFLSLQPLPELTRYELPPDQYTINDERST